MKTTIIKGDIVQQKVDALIVGHLQGEEELGGAIGALDAALEGEIQSAIASGEFTGAHGTTMTVRTHNRLEARTVIVVGLGSRDDLDHERVRQAAGSAMKVTRSLKAVSVASVALGAGQGGLETRASGVAVLEGLRLAAYVYGPWKKPSKDVKELVSLMLVEIVPAKVTTLKKVLPQVDASVAGVCVARDLVNQAPMHLLPKELKAEAERIAKENPSVSVKVLNRAQCKKLGMNAFLAVAEGADSEPYFIHLTYKPKKKARKRVALVGKGITFDSGGLSIKPSQGMETMKADMGGAAAVLGVFESIDKVGPSVEVHGLIAACENMPSGRSYRPGDVVRAMNGTSIEVLNTDAEGRVTMADSLSYACAKVKPDAIIDLATLTGACVVALGEEIVGVMTRNDELAEALFAAADETGEEMWELPLFKPYKKLLKSKIADIKNIGSRWGGALTAGLFLEYFVDKDIPWVHLDIAGPAFAEREYLSYVPYGGSGVMVRTLLTYLGDI